MDRVFTAKAIDNVQRQQDADHLLETLSRAESSAVVSLSDGEKDLRDAIAKVFQPPKAGVQVLRGPCQGMAHSFTL